VSVGGHVLQQQRHDRVAQTLATMLIDLERFKSDQAGRASVLRQFDLLQEWTRDALNHVGNKPFSAEESSWQGYASR